MDAYDRSMMMMMMPTGDPIGMGWHAGYAPRPKRKKMEYVRPADASAGKDGKEDTGMDGETEGEKKAKKLASIRAMREEQAAKNRALAEKREEKIKQMNELQERKRKIAEEKKKRVEELQLKRDAILAAKEAELQELRQKLAEKTTGRMS